MRAITALGLATAVGFGAAACDMGAEDGADTVPLEQSEPEPVETEPERVEGTSSLQVDSLADGGAYLTDASGRALYLIEGEPQDSSTCYDECAEEWPPFVAAGGVPTAGGDEVRADLIGTIQRRDGQPQVTYAGHPLYYYHDDQGPGDIEGQDVTDDWGEWYLVRPDGDPLENSGANDGG